MEKIKLHILKKAIQETRENCSDPISRDALDRIMKSVQVCPAQFLRLTKMYESVMKIKRESGARASEKTKNIILSNFNERTIAGY